MFLHRCIVLCACWVPALFGTCQTSTPLVREIPWYVSEDSLFALASAWFADTTYLSTVVLGKAIPETKTVVGAGSSVVRYEAGTGPNGKKGTMTFVYNVKLEAYPELFKLTIYDLKLDGLPLVNDTCWQPCNNDPYPKNRDDRHSRMIEDSIWRQVAGSARSEMASVIDRLFMFLLMTRNPSPRR